MDEYLTVAQLRHLLGAFPDDAYVSLVMEFGDQRMLAVDSLVSVTDGSQAQNMSHVYLYGETTIPILNESADDDIDPDDMFPCVHGHFDCATEDHGPCGDEQRARNFAAQLESDTGISVDGEPING